MPALSGAQMGSNHRITGDWCPGCGLHHAVTGEHRADCTTLPPACTHCRYHPSVHGTHRHDCPHHRKAPTA